MRTPSIRAGEMGGPLVCVCSAVRGPLAGPAYYRDHAFTRPLDVEIGPVAVRSATRPIKCPEAANAIRLQQVDPKATYELTDLDAGIAAGISGKELREKGLTVEIQNKPGAAMIIYKRIP